MNERISTDGINSERLQDLKALASKIDSQLATFKEKLNVEDSEGGSPEWRFAYSLVVHGLSEVALRNSALIEVMSLFESQESTKAIA